MKGIVFREFIDMVSERFSEELCDEIIEEAALPSKGAYTTLGTYDFNEMLALVDRLHARSGVPVPELLRAFGEYLLGRFSAQYPVFFAEHGDTFSFLERLEAYIHQEVLKLYPDAELPAFSFQRPTHDRMELTYSSPRALSDLAEGLIQGLSKHYGESIALKCGDLSGGRKTHVRFVLNRIPRNG